MKKIIIGFLVIVSICGFLVIVSIRGLLEGQGWAERFKMPDLPQASTTKVVALDKGSGAFLWQSISTNEVGNEGGKVFIRVTQNGSGRYGGSKEPIDWKIVGYYYADPYIRPYYSKKEIYSKSGKLLKADTFNYQYADKKIYFTRENKINNKTAQQTFKFEDDMIDKYILGTAILSYPFDKKRDFNFHYLSDEPKVYSLTLHYRGKEVVTVPAGTFECHKLEMTVDLGLLGIVGAFIPKTYFWYSSGGSIECGEPIEWVKYEGLESGLGTPYIVMTLPEKPIRINKTENPTRESPKK
jgi:hypothetical protein